MRPQDISGAEQRSTSGSLTSLAPGVCDNPVGTQSNPLPYLIVKLDRLLGHK